MIRAHALSVALIAAASVPALGHDGTDLSTLARSAERVVVATVTDVQAVFQTNEFGDQLIVSRAHVRVDAVLKNRRGGASQPGEALIVEVEGGTIGDLTLAVSDMPRIGKGERAVLFLHQNKRGANVPHGRGDGILKLDPSDRVRGKALTLSAIRQAVEQAR